MTTLSIRVAESGEDVEQNTGTLVINTTGGSLDMGRDDVGLHFRDIAVTQGQVLTRAYLEFVASAGDSASPVNLTIYAEDTDSASVFSTGTGALDALTVTTANTAWNPTAWVLNTVYQSPNITDVIQEIIDRPGWVSNNEINVVIFGDGVNRRRAKSYDNVTTEAPLLVIEFTAAGDQDADGTVGTIVSMVGEASAAVAVSDSSGAIVGMTAESGTLQAVDADSIGVILGAEIDGTPSFGGSADYQVVLGATATAATYPARRAPNDRILSIGREY